MTTVERVLSAFSGVTPRGHLSWMVHCPAHNDPNASLQISMGHTGKVVMRCHGGCQTKDVLAAVGLAFQDLSGDASVTTEVNTAPPPTFLLADVPHRHAVYSELLRVWTLGRVHHKELLDRGLNEEDIRRNGYRTFDWWAAQKLISANEWKLDLAGVPGFLDAGPRYEVADISGLVIPVRSLAGNIQALQVRNPSTRAKYRWFSWTGQTTNVPHVPAATAFKMLPSFVRLTEGPLKADVARSLEPSVETIAVPGVSSWRAAIPLLKTIRAMAGINAVHLAFDMDWKTKPAVFAQMNAARQGLQLEGFRVFLESWDYGKGLDDYLLWRQQNGGEQRSDSGVSGL